MRSIAVMAALSAGFPIAGDEPRLCQHRPRDDIEYLPIEPKPLTKRQRRRLRGKRRAA